MAIHSKILKRGGSRLKKMIAKNAKKGKKSSPGRSSTPVRRKRGNLANTSRGR